MRLLLLDTALRYPLAYGGDVWVHLHSKASNKCRYILQGNAVFKFNPDLLYQTLDTSISERYCMNLRVNNSASRSEKSFQAQTIDKVPGWALTHCLSSRSELPRSFFILVISVPIRASREQASSCPTCKKVYFDCKEVESISLYIQDFVRPITSYDALQLWWDHIELCLTFVRWINTSRWNFASTSSIRSSLTYALITSLNTGRYRILG